MTARGPRAARAAAATLLLLGAAGAGAQQTPPSGTTPATADSARRAPGLAPGDTTRGVSRVMVDSAITPQLDPARMTDAELRIALFQLLNDRHIPALRHLQTATAVNPAGGSAGTAGTTGGAGAVAGIGTSPTGGVGRMLGREDGLFLLAQSYWRLGMDQQFRAAADAVMASPSSARYAPILRAQMLLEAYRHGDVNRALQLSQQLQSSPVGGLASLVAGLTYYQQGQWAQARTAFASASQAPGPYAPYARYMDALAQLRADTAQTAAALQSLESVASGASGEFGEQVRLTAAQLAYEAERYADAARIAAAIPQASGLAAEALLTRAWALYKSNQTAEAAAAFQEFATRYPNLPQREEARLMQAQVLLQQNQTTQASTAFRSVADSARTVLQLLEARTAQTMSDAARALVSARAAGLLFITDPASGKTVALGDGAGSDAAVLAAVTRDTTVATPEARTPEIISLTDVDQRLQQLGPAVTEVPRRAVYVQTSATNNRVEYAGRAQALYDADVAVALARFRVQEALDMQQAQLTMLRALQLRLAGDSSTFTPFAARLQAAQDSLARLDVALDAAGTRLRQMFVAQVNTTRMLAQENAVLIDSLRRELGASASENDRRIIDLEANTASTYAGLADLLAGGIDRAIGSHPVFARRDSVRAHADSSRATLAQARQALTDAQTLVASEITRIEGTDLAAPYRSALAAAEQRRTAAEAQLVATVARELDARATELLADLRRDVEAAEFGSASASFFEALEAGRTTGTGGTTGGAGGTASTRQGGDVTASAQATSSPRK